MANQNDEDVRIQQVNYKAKLLVRELLLVRGLYSEIDTKDEVGAAAEWRIRQANIGTFDCYCTTCKRETPFIISEMPVAMSGGGLRGGNALRTPPSVMAVRAVCQRDLTTYVYAFQKVGERLIKVGQQPSMADISFGELGSIDNTLDPVDRRELGKAIGLFAHDAASGAFVYLRRVFERMITRAHERKELEGNPIKGFDDLRLDEKISALKDELPEKVVKNSAVFSVLSVGIHELDDEQCKSYFPVLKAVIFQMLEKEEHKRRKDISERETDAAFQALLSAARPKKAPKDVASTTKTNVENPATGESESEASDASPTA